MHEAILFLTVLFVPVWCCCTFTVAFTFLWCKTSAWLRSVLLRNKNTCYFKKKVIFF
jgi:hypothetical protein